MASAYRALPLSSRREGSFYSEQLWISDVSVGEVLPIPQVVEFLGAGVVACTPSDASEALNWLWEGLLPTAPNGLSPLRADRIVTSSGDT
jgi:hypothetical protein